MTMQDGVVDEAYIDRLMYDGASSELADGVYDFMAQVARVAPRTSSLHLGFGTDPRALHRRTRRKMLADKDEGEVGEFLSADFENDLAEYVDGAIDIAFVALGAVFEAVDGRQVVAEALIREVVRSNLDKFGPGSRVREDGKILKPVGWQPPKIREILEYFGVEIPKGLDSSYVMTSEKVAEDSVNLPDGTQVSLDGEQPDQKEVLSNLFGTKVKD